MNRNMYIKVDKKTLKELKNALKTVFEFQDEIQINTTNNYIGITGIDKAQICLYDFKALKEAFSEWHDIKNDKIGINLKEFLVFLNNFKDAVNITISEDGTTLYDGIQKYITKNIEIEEQQLPDIKNLTWLLKAKIDFKEFLKYVNTFSNVAEAVAIENRNRKLYLKCGDSEVLIGETYSQEKIRTLASIEYLLKLKRLKDFDAEVYIGNDYPIKFVFRNNGLKFVVIIAPRMEVD